METEITFPEALPLDPRDELHYPLHETGLHKATVAFLRFLFHGVMKLDVSGLENLPREGAAVLAANHVTNLDIFPLQLALPRPIFYMGKAELFEVGFVHYLFRNLGAFPVRRGERDEWAIQHARRILEAGEVLGMFPEGTRSRGRGLKVAKTGAARLALAGNCPLVPVAIVGSDAFFKRFPRRSRVAIQIGEPIMPKPDELPLALTDRLMFAVAQMLPGNMRGVYAVKPEGFE